MSDERKLILVLKDIHKSFGAVAALKGVSAGIGEGEGEVAAVGGPGVIAQLAASLAGDLDEIIDGLIAANQVVETEEK